jgi:hypothetical protein
MRQGQQSRRGRNRGGRKPQNALSRNYESSGPDVKIRGTAMHIAEKYSSLARDAMSSGDTVAAENYLQHAEHYNRIIMAAQAQSPGLPGVDGLPAMNGRFGPSDAFGRDYDGDSDDGDGDDYAPPPPPQPQPQRQFPERVAYNQNQPQPYIPQNAFPQIQPQPVVAAPNGAPSPQSGEPFPGPQDGAAPRRRRRRPIGEGPFKPFNGRSANGAPGNGSPTPEADSKPDEAAS